MRRTGAVSRFTEITRAIVVGGYGSKSATIIACLCEKPALHFIFVVAEAAGQFLLEYVK